MGTDKRARQKANRLVRQQQAVRQQRKSDLTRKVVIGLVMAVIAVLAVIGLAKVSGIGGDDDNPPTPSADVTAGLADDTTG